MDSRRNSIYLWQSKFAPTIIENVNLNSLMVPDKGARKVNLVIQQIPLNAIRCSKPQPRNDRGRGGRGKRAQGHIRPSRGGSNYSDPQPYNEHQYPVSTQNRFEALRHNGELAYAGSPRPPFLGRGRRGAR